MTATYSYLEQNSTNPENTGVGYTLQGTGFTFVSQIPIIYMTDRMIPATYGPHPVYGNKSVYYSIGSAVFVYTPPGQTTYNYVNSLATKTMCFIIKATGTAVSIWHQFELLNPGINTSKAWIWNAVAEITTI